SLSVLCLSFHSFFFSSRRRHTRFSRDWSSDVCSSDLDALQRLNPAVGFGNVASRQNDVAPDFLLALRAAHRTVTFTGVTSQFFGLISRNAPKIGRAHV